MQGTKNKEFIYSRPDSKWLWMSYEINGKRYRESTRTTNAADARRVLKNRMRELKEDSKPANVFAKTKYEDLEELLISDYMLNGRKSTDKLKVPLSHLKKEFAGELASGITSARSLQYAKKRLSEGAKPATTNRELSALGRMFTLGLRYGLVTSRPNFTILRERNVRTGFLEPEEFLKLRTALPDFFKGPVTLAYLTGFRRGEVFDLTWSKVNLRDGFVRLESADTKNSRPRTVYLTDEALDCLQEAYDNRKPGCDLVFHCDGRRIRDCRTSWKKACASIGKEDLLFHDLRRSAVRNLTRAGIPERVCMEISGHRTRSIFDRYNIISEDDLINAAKRLSGYLSLSKQPIQQT